MLSTRIPTPFYEGAMIKEKDNVEPSLNDSSLIKKLAYLENQTTDEFIKRHWNQIKKENTGEDNPRWLVQLADANILRNAIGRAVDQYKKALSKDPLILYAYPRIITALIRLGNINEARNYHEQLIKMTQNRSDFVHDYVLFKLFFYRNPETTKESIASLNKILKNEPNNYHVLNTLGFIHLSDQNNIDQAKKFFQAAIQINNNYAIAINNLGVCYFRKEKYTEAEQYYLKAHKLDQFYSAPYENLSSLYGKKGNYQLALDYLNKADENNVELAPHIQFQKGNLLFELKRYEESIDWLLEKKEENPGNYSILNNLGTNYSRLNKNEKAIEYYKQAIEVFKSNPIQRTSLDAFYNLGRMAMFTADTQLMREASNNLLQIQQNNVYGHYLAGASAHRRNDYALAKIHLERAIELDSEYVDAYTDLSFVLMCIDHKYDAAIKLLEPVAKRYPEHILIQNNLAYAYIEVGKLKKAEEILNKFRDHLPVNLKITKGLLEIRSKRLEIGNTYYQESISKLPEERQRNIANQIWKFEQAKYWADKKDFEKAFELIEQADNFETSYLSEEIKSFKKEVRRLIRQAQSQKLRNS